MFISIKTAPLNPKQLTLTFCTVSYSVVNLFQTSLARSFEPLQASLAKATRSLCDLGLHASLACILRFALTKFFEKEVSLKRIKMHQ